MNKRILFIVEGEHDEVRFLNSLYSTCFSGNNYQIYSYRTNIHILALVLNTEYPDFMNHEIDIRLLLRSKEQDEQKRELLSQTYSDIYLVFDFEPQHDVPHFEMIKKMMGYFDDSTDRGKLFINYPMIQSYKHLVTLPDPGFENRSVTIAQTKQYKQIVGDESAFTDLSAYNYPIFMSIAVHHIRKANKLLTGKYCLPGTDEYMSWKGSDIYDVEYSLMEQHGIINVLNTVIFLLVDYRPHHFFESISTHSNDFDI